MAATVKENAMTLSNMVFFVMIIPATIQENITSTPTLNLQVRQTLATSITIDVIKPHALVNTWITYYEIPRDNGTSVELRNKTIRSLKMEVTVALRDLQPSTAYNICANGRALDSEETVQACTEGTTNSRFENARNIVIALASVSVFLVVAIVLTLILKYCKPFSEWRKSTKVIKRNSMVGPKEQQNDENATF